jgi:hypothetical protein
MRLASCLLRRYAGTRHAVTTVVCGCGFAALCSLWPSFQCFRSQFFRFPAITALPAISAISTNLQALRFGKKLDHPLNQAAGLTAINHPMIKTECEFSLDPGYEAV